MTILSKPSMSSRVNRRDPRSTNSLDDAPEGGEIKGDILSAYRLGRKTPGRRLQIRCCLARWVLAAPHAIFLKRSGHPFGKIIRRVWVTRKIAAPHRLPRAAM